MATARVITLNLSAEDRKAANDHELGEIAARDRLLVDPPLAVINAGLDLSYDEHTRAYVDGWIAVAVDAAGALVLELTAAIKTALENV